MVIDIGVNESEEGLVMLIQGFEKNASKVTPVPGGVGPLMVISFLKNVLKAARLQS